MKLAWTLLALSVLHHIYDFIAEDNVEAARKMIEKIKECVQKLASYPYIGRNGRISGTREFSIPQSPFIIIYRIKV